MTTPLLLPSGALDPLLDQIRHHGHSGRETGALLLTRPGEPEVQVLALTGIAGIERGIGLFFIGAAALDRLFTYAEQRGLQVRAMIHSHPEDAFLSPVDQRCTLRVPGFVSAVVPNFAHPPTDPKDWGWWRWVTSWNPCSAPTVAALPTPRVMSFDAEGIHEH